MTSTIDRPVSTTDYLDADANPTALVGWLKMHGRRGRPCFYVQDDRLILVPSPGSDAADLARRLDAVEADNRLFLDACGDDHQTTIRQTRRALRRIARGGR